MDEKLLNLTKAVVNFGKSVTSSSRQTENILKKALETSNLDDVNEKYVKNVYNSIEAPIVKAWMDKKIRENEERHRAEELRLHGNFNQLAQEANEIAQNANKLAEGANKVAEDARDDAKLANRIALGAIIFTLLNFIYELFFKSK